MARPSRTKHTDISAHPGPLRSQSTQKKRSDRSDVLPATSPPSLDIKQSLPLATIALVILLLGLAGGAIWMVVLNTPAPPPLQEQTLVEQFVALHQAGNPEALDLLGPDPQVPAKPITPAEAQRLQTEFFLRQPIEIKEFSRRLFTDGKWVTLPPGQFVLVVEGELAAPEMPVLTDAGVKPRQRTMYNPDLIVEVRDSKLRGIRAQLHEGP